MSTNQIIMVVALLIISFFVGGLVLVGLPQTLLEWVITDGILAILLYVSYLVITAVKGPSKPRFH